ncbi:MAG: hypothetical protein J1E34_09685 [Oscillospiraceae bacterium]|nr:hypothetical protein [Oscillospiraceae bacterium]
MNFSIIYNPIASRFTDEALSHFIKSFENKGLTLYKAVKSEYSGHVIPLIKELDPVSDYLFTLGGDGTVNEAVRAFNDIEQHSIYGHISVGTTNDMANNFNLSRKNAIESINKLASEGVQTQMDSIIVNGEPVSYVSSFGYVAPVPYLVNVNLKKKLGHAAYVVSALPILARKPEWVNLRYTANGETKEIKTCLALITTSKGMGGITLYHNADMNDGKFEVFFLEKISPKLIAEIFPHYLSDTVDFSKYSKYCTCFSTDKMTIEFIGMPPKYDLDNDGNQASFHLTMHERKLEFSIGKKIKILKPLK